jgi:predicted nucleic acid-binding protein
VDAMIAAVSIACDAIFVTANKKHFENIQDLKLDSWEID